MFNAQTQLKDKNDIKIFILCLMKQVGCALNYPEINDIVIQDGIVNYFDFVECFAELLDAGNVCELHTDAKNPVYSITEQGNHVAENLQSSISQSLREKSMRSALRLLAFQRQGISAKCSSSELPENKYMFSCLIIQNDNELLSLNVVVDSKKQLDRCIYNFNEYSENVYRGILAVISGDANYYLG